MIFISPRLLCLLLLSGDALAQAQHSKTFESVDGPVTVSWGQPDQAQPNVGPANFAELDRNSDGRLSLSETAAHPLLHSDFLFVDRNRDGAITRKELARWN